MVVRGGEISSAEVLDANGIDLKVSALAIAGLAAAGRLVLRRFQSSWPKAKAWNGSSFHLVVPCGRCNIRWRHGRVDGVTRQGRTNLLVVPND
ncbi:hypothetical protein MESS2_p40016 [Mesorhizobium metallidurans STM 2683]|uniref:Uncharacterized protein n=1 Tax=Mesorhizobium metallidurans STM 2683 TaxID=1297569 RepID=M5EZA8_9HYPH|nr:hypothetical protein MESS2_p40016 [Mesorhizobium metallidurans STM 2683]